MEYKDTILDLIGNTPLIKINKINKGLRPQIFAKLESANPGGSVKDRIGYSMIVDAEKKGTLKPGGTIIEATSGNTGIGLAITAAVKGYRCLFVCTDKVSSEKINYLKAFGADVIVVPNTYEPDHPEYYVNVARRIHEETPNSVFAYQYGNPSNPEMHYRTTGPEIWRQTKGKITHFVSSIGTGGTISGTGRFLKEKNPNIQVIGADPIGSIFKHYKETGEIIKGTPYLVEGIGQDCLPANVHFQYIDKIINISDKDSFAAARRLTKEEGIFCGGSTGTIVHVVLEIAKNLTENDVIVFIVCDTGERYLSKVYNEAWLQMNRMLDTEVKVLGDISYNKKRKGFGGMVYVHDNATIRQALKIMSSKGFTYLPVLNGSLKPVGSLREGHVLSRMLDDPKMLDAPVKEIMEESFRVLDAKSSIAEVRNALKEAPAVLVSNFGRITDIITRYDLIDFE